MGKTVPPMAKATTPKGDDASFSPLSLTMTPRVPATKGSAGPPRWSMTVWPRRRRSPGPGCSSTPRALTQLICTSRVRWIRSQVTVSLPRAISVTMPMSRGSIPYAAPLEVPTEERTTKSKRARPDAATAVAAGADSAAAASLAAGAPADAAALAATKAAHGMAPGPLQHERHIPHAMQPASRSLQSHKSFPAVPEAHAAPRAVQSPQRAHFRTAPAEKS